MDNDMHKAALDRRSFVTAGVVLVTTTVLSGQAAIADLPEMKAAMDEVLGGRRAEESRISLELPEIAEDGNTVPLTVEVESPMTEDDHVRAIHIFSEANPSPNVASMQLSPRSGEAIVSTRIRLAKTQKIHALAEMSNGSVFSAARNVKVTVGGCGS